MLQCGSGGESLPEDKETKVRLLESARREFMEKGYMKASLRNICKNAGVTTGALYFFFQDKEALFAELVEGPLQKLYEIMYGHYHAEMEAMTHLTDADKPADKGKSSSFSAAEGESAEQELEASDPESEMYSDDQKAAALIVHYMYQYYEEFMMILIKSQGSRFASCVDQFVEITEQHYRILADRMSEQENLPFVEDYLIHWMSHMTIDMFVYLLTHEPSEQAALQHVKPIIQYMLEGWYGMFRKKTETLEDRF